MAQDQAGMNWEIRRNEVENVNVGLLLEKLVKEQCVMQLRCVLDTHWTLSRRTFQILTLNHLYDKTTSVSNEHLKENHLRLVV